MCFFLLASTRMRRAARRTRMVCMENNYNNNNNNNKTTTIYSTVSLLCTWSKREKAEVTPFLRIHRRQAFTRVCVVRVSECSNLHCTQFTERHAPHKAKRTKMFCFLTVDWFPQCLHKNNGLVCTSIPPRPTMKNTLSIPALCMRCCVWLI